MNAVVAVVRTHGRWLVRPSTAVAEQNYPSQHIFLQERFLLQHYSERRWLARAARRIPSLELEKS